LPFGQFCLFVRSDANRYDEPMVVQGIKQAVILAAGESSRFWPLCEGSHKSLIQLLGQPLIVWTLRALRRADISSAIIVQSAEHLIERALGDGSVFQIDLKLKYVTQEEPSGMGDALLRAESLLDERFFVLNPQQATADRWLPLMAEKATRTKAAAVLTGLETDQPAKYGILKLDGDRARDLIEKPAEPEAPSKIRVAGIYLLQHGFFDVYKQVEPGTYAFEAALAQLMRKADVRVVVNDEGEAPSLKYPWDLFGIAQLLMNEQIKEPQIAPSAQIAKSAVVEGSVIIGERARIYEQAVIKGPCYLGDDVIVGTGSLVRDFSDLETGVLIGAHAEIARSIFQPDCHTHSGYFGDSIFDRSCRVGAGTITANVRADRDEIYARVKGARVATGSRSLGAIVGAETQLGIGTLLMPGVLVGSHCTVGPGTIVTKNIPSDTLSYVKQEHVVRRRKP
jgi:bifunctional UDP-N-acetylglucosamine pyrophosphorylase/glucosamine-1-phosphate N-acetyltransferase